MEARSQLRHRPISCDASIIVQSMDRSTAWELLCEFTKSESLRKHGLSVATCMEAYARHRGEDADQWYLTGLLHDFDWEVHPTLPEHPRNGSPILAERGVSEEIRRAILSHANLPDVPRLTLMEKTLFACDELAGFLTAISYVKPGRSIHEVDVAGVRKKMKDKAFARAVNREDILTGAAELEVPLDEHIAFCIQAMQANAQALGLGGTTT